MLKTFFLLCAKKRKEAQTPAANDSPETHVRYVTYVIYAIYADDSLFEFTHTHICTLVSPHGQTQTAPNIKRDLLYDERDLIHLPHTDRLSLPQGMHVHVCAYASVRELTPPYPLHWHSVCVCVCACMHVYSTHVCMYIQLKGTPDSPNELPRRIWRICRVCMYIQLKGTSYSPNELPRRIWRICRVWCV